MGRLSPKSAWLDALGHAAMVGHVRDLVFVGAHEQDGRGLEVVSAVTVPV